MYYVINKENVCVCSSQSKLNEEDLASRGEYSVKLDDDSLNIGDTYIGGAITPIVEPTTEQKLAAIRVKRDELLNSTSYIFQRQLTGSDTQKLSEEDYQKWVEYWQLLRDFPDTCDVNNPVFPEQPTVK